MLSAWLDFLREDEFDDSQESSTSAAARPNLPRLDDNLESLDFVHEVKDHQHSHLLMIYSL